MGDWLSDAWGSQWNPFSGKLFSTGIPNTLTSAWKDFTGQSQYELSEKAARQNTATQIAWERERAKNAHQWEVEDLENAGLNPILSAGGSGAATGGINPPMPDYSNFKGNMGALASLLTKTIEMKNMLAQGRKANSEAKLNNAKVSTENTTQLLNSAITGHTSQKAAAQMIENEILRNKKFMSDIDADWYETEKYIDNIGKPILKTAEDVMKFKLLKDAFKNGKRYTNPEVYNKKTGEIRNKWYKNKDGKWKKLDGDWTDLFY